MYAIDFKYDGRLLSEYGFIICDFNPSNGVSTSQSGGKISFKTASINKGRYSSLVDYRFDECIKATFDICKNPEVFDDLEITDDEFLMLMRWLNRKDFHQLRFYNDDTYEHVRYYNGSFEISKIKINERLFGLGLVLTTDKPYAYGEKNEFNWECKNNLSHAMLCDSSNDIGCITPVVEITCLESGNFVIQNETFDSTMIINDCVENEIITVNGYTKIITTSNDSHNISNSFNYEFLKIGNTLENRYNKIKANKRCKISITYYPIIKDIL